MKIDQNNVLELNLTFSNEYFIPKEQILHSKVLKNVTVSSEREKRVLPDFQGT